MPTPSASIRTGVYELMTRFGLGGWFLRGCGHARRASSTPRVIRKEWIACEPEVD